MRIFILSLCLLMPSISLGTIESSIATIDSLIKSGKKIAILVIDMQIFFANDFSLPENVSAIRQQERLLLEYVDNPDVHFIDVNLNILVDMEDLPLRNAETIPRLKRLQKRKSTYKKFFKLSDDAFEEPAVIEGYENYENALKGDLGDHLESEGITEVMPIGCFDGGCIISTAEGALERGFNVYVDRDLNVLKGIINEELSVIDVELENQMLWDELIERNPNLSLIDYIIVELEDCSIN